MKQIAIATAALLGLLTSSTASAILITDSIDVNAFLSMGQSASWQHDFTDDLAFPTTGSISDANLSVYLWDDGDRQSEFALGRSDSGGWVLGEVDTGLYSFGIDVASLANGLFDVRVTSLYGDFGIGTSTLSFEFTRDGETSSVSVPEPASLGLLGASLLVAGLASRRRRRKLC